MLQSIVLKVDQVCIVRQKEAREIRINCKIYSARAVHTHTQLTETLAPLVLSVILRAGALHRPVSIMI